MCYLPCRMNSRVGAARADDRKLVTPENSGERFMKFTLNGPLVALFLPAVEQLTVIGDLELQSTSHCEYPRTEWGIG
jgi:hypothetical protein